ncbi:unnamed protein product, partial [Meganyctiphanes norvegica]
MKQGSHPNLCSPRGSTMVPFSRPWNKITLSPGFPEEYAIVQRATADLSSKPSSSLCRPSGPSGSSNHLMNGPGSPPKTLKHRQVSSMMTGALTMAAAASHLAQLTTSGSPCNSGRSSFSLSNL